MHLDCLNNLGMDKLKEKTYEYDLRICVFSFVSFFNRSHTHILHFLLRSHLSIETELLFLSVPFWSHHFYTFCIWSSSYLMISWIKCTSHKMMTRGDNSLFCMMQLIKCTDIFFDMREEKKKKKCKTHFMIDFYSHIMLTDSVLCILDKAWHIFH